MPEPEAPRRPARIYSVLVGLVFIALIAVAAINTLHSAPSGLLGLGAEGRNVPLPEFAVADARSNLSGDANIAQDDCEVSTRPCPQDRRRTPACRVNERGALRVCDLFGRPAILSFWFTRGGDCESQQDTFEAVYRRYRDRVNFLAVDVRDSRETVRKLIAERGWTHPIGLDTDGALANLYRIEGCPTFLYAYPGGILRETSIGELSAAELGARLDALIRHSQQRRETSL